MKIKNYFLTGIVVLCSLTAPPASADKITMINGDHFTGTLMERKGPRLSFKTEYAGTIRIKWEFVKSLETDEPALLLFDNGESKSVISVELGEDEVVYTSAGDKQQHSMLSSAIVGISPKSWENNESGVWSGFADLSIKSDRGNGDEDFLDLEANVRYRRKNDRFRFYGEWEHDKKVVTASGETRTTKRKSYIRSSYDYFFNDKTYVAYSLALENNDLSDLNLRTSVGPLLGYQFYESRPLNLLTEVGVLWVGEDYNDAADKHYWQPAWRIDFDKYVFGDHLQIYHEQTGTVRVDDTHRWLLKSWTGFRVPTKSGIQYGVEYKLDYDSQPINQVESTETTVRIKLGYKW